jgi:hypothetical protein
VFESISNIGPVSMLWADIENSWMNVPIEYGDLPDT